VYFEGDRLVTRRLDSGQTQCSHSMIGGARTIAQLTPPGYPGSDRVKVLFQVDQQRCLRMTVEDLLTQQTLLQNQVVAQLLTTKEKLKLFHFFTFFDLTVLDSIVNFGISWSSVSLRLSQTRLRRVERGLVT